MERRVAMVAVMRCVSFIVVLCLLFYGCGDGGDVVCRCGEVGGARLAA